MRNLPESALFAPVARWLKHLGYKVFAELWGHDLVAILGTHIVVVELKMTCSRQVIRQAGKAGISFADAAYAAVPRVPRKSSIAKCVGYKIGLLVVTDSVTVIVQPECHYFHKGEHAQVIEQLTKREPDDRVGGVPTLAGTGPAQNCVKLVDEYRRNNPKARWQDVFRDVPNHYAHHRSMAGALAKARRR